MPRVFVALADKELDATAMATLVREPTKGGVVLFLGDVRGVTGERTTDHLEYEAYASMAVKTMQAIADEAAATYEANVAIIHRLGKLGPGETTVICAAACAHRTEAFACCRELIDRLKKEVPIWKKEVGPDGSEWVGA